MNEIKLSNPDITYTPSVVTYDFTAIDEDIRELEKRYLKWVPSEDEITDGTKIAKDINRLAEGLNNEKKEMKKVINAQGIAFEKDAMERVKRLKAIRENILDGLDVFEEQRKKEKKEEIHQYFLQERDMEIPFERVWSDEWLKKTCAKKKWQSDIQIELDAIQRDYEMLDKMNAEDPELLKSIYLQLWDRLKAIDEYNHQKDIRKKAEELREIKAAQKAEVNCVKKSLEDKEERCPAPEAPETRFVSNMVMISGSESAWIQAKEYMQNIGLKVEVL
ncbi:DUF1351 domain-containing protein [[Clostridium] innocuum]|nr:DUF1351 domain-containing protein [[Clostridium] innocuum]